jgi:molybdopterin converting factor small subunit
LVDQDEPTDPFSPEEDSTINAKFNGIRQFDDTLGTCRIASSSPKLQLDCLNAVTGWDLSLKDAFHIGLRIINQLRMFNIRQGIKKEDERPSKRYGSVPVDGPAKGKDIMAQWDSMLTNYYTLMGWDSETGFPLPETLQSLELGELARDLGVMDRVCVEICLWLGAELGPDFRRISDMCSARMERIDPGATIAELMSSLAGRYPLLLEKVFDPERTRFSPYVAVNFNNRVINPKQVHHQALRNGDKITVLPIYSGG